ncbi:hypothetical protein Pdw03_6939 [Penicillium digitatum]|uniref:Uncharacterized protein n=1 Tax=Penicillium digitatum TaxID=36651 RepID=A0A7T6XKX3_PENDI|nr:hypothetical protein Pdw03_6939 [Penicillium digitatum]
MQRKFYMKGLKPSPLPLGPYSHVLCHYLAIHMKICWSYEHAERLCCDTIDLISVHSTQTSLVGGQSLEYVTKTPRRFLYQTKMHGRTSIQHCRDGVLRTDTEGCMNRDKDPGSQ